MLMLLLKHISKLRCKFAFHMPKLSLAWPKCFNQLESLVMQAPLNLYFLQLFSPNIVQSSFCILARIYAKQFIRV